MGRAGLIIRKFQRGKSRPIVIDDEGGVASSPSTSLNLNSIKPMSVISQQILNSIGIPLLDNSNESDSKTIKIKNEI